MKVFASVKKSDEYEQIVMGEVYIPMALDSDGAFMTAEEIKKLAYLFLGKRLQLNVDTNHDNEMNGAIVVESFIAREGDPIFIPGAWVVAVWLPIEVFEKVLSNELNGFSIEMAVLMEKKQIAYNMPSVLYGETSDNSGHKHPFKIYISEASDGDQHYHLISHGTVTNPAGADQHVHTFEFVQLYLDGEPMVIEDGQ